MNKKEQKKRSKKFNSVYSETKPPTPIMTKKNWYGMEMDEKQKELDELFKKDIRKRKLILELKIWNIYICSSIMIGVLIGLIISKYK